MAVKFLNGIDVVGSMNITANDIPDHSARKITSDTLDAARIPDLSGTYQPVGNYLTSIPSEYLTQTEGDARYLQSLPSHNHDGDYLEYSYSDVNMDTYDGDRSLLLGRNLGGWSSGTKPSGSHNGFGILHVTTHVGGYATQFGFDTNQNKIWVRSKNPTSWGSWKNMWTEQDFTSTNISNWNTAYGWGNHASAGYLTSIPSSYATDAEVNSAVSVVNDRIETEILPSIPTNNNQLTNGAGYITSADGGNAQTLDGINSTSFLRSDANDTHSGTLALTAITAASGSIANTKGSYLHIGAWGTGRTAVDAVLVNTAYRSDYATNLFNENISRFTNDSGYTTEAYVDAAASDVNTRIDTEVLPSIPTNNNQLTNGAGYITDGNTGWNNSYGFITSTVTSSLTIAGSETRGTYTSASQYHSGADNLVLKGNSVGISSIFFESEKDGTNINHPSDFGFIQYHAYGTSTSGEVNELIIGVSNDADDHLILNAPNVNGLKFRVGASETDYNVYHSGNLSLATLGYTGATNANYITNNNQLTNGAGYATTSYVNTAVSNLVASAPAALDTLNELAAALGDDANFSTTIANNIGAVNTRIDTEVFPAIDAKQNAGNYATFSYITLNDSTTTASFIAELTNEHGAFQDNYRAYKVGWSYAGNSDLDVGFESVELAGCLIECFGGTYKHVRLTRPTTGTGGRSIYVYNDQGSSYAPGWRQIWTSDEFSSTNVSNWNTAYGWGNHASAGYLTSIPSTYATDAEVNTAVSAVNDIIDTEVLPVLGGKLDATAKAADSNLLDGIDSSSFVQTSGNQTITGTKTFASGSIAIEGSHGTISFIDNTSSADDFYIHVNSNNFYILADRDGSNGVDGGYDAPHPLQLEGDTNKAFFFGNEVKSAAYELSSAFDAAGSATAVQTWVGEQNYASDAAISTAIATVTLSSLGYTGATNANYITNNNQLTNGAGYLVQGGTQEPGGWTSATRFKSSGNIADADSGSHSLQVISDNSNDAFMAFHVSGDYAVFFGLDGVSNRLHTGGWSAGATQYQIFDTRDFSAADVGRGVTANGWGDHGAAGYATQTWVGEQNYASDAAISTAIGEVTLATLGYTGATNANYITNNNQLTNGAGYLTSSNDRVYITDSRGSARAPSYYNDRYAQWDFQSSADTGAGGDGWHALLTVSKWSSWNASHRQEQLLFTGDDLKRRTATSDSAWSAVKTIWDSGNLDAFVGATVSNDTITFTKANGGTVAVTTSDADTNTWRPIDDTPVNGVTDQSISSNWAYDHVNASNPHGTTAADVGADAVGSAAAVNTALSEEIGNLSTSVSANTTELATNRTAITTNATNISALSTSISTGSVTIGSGVTLSESTDRSDLLMIKSSTSSWGGLQISNTSNEIIFSMMGDGNLMGLYDDVNNDWILQRDENGAMRFYANASNTVTVTTSGLSVTGAITASGDITAFSDARVKENVETLPNALESVKQMRGVTYNKIGEEKQSVGVIAQELEEVVPQLVHTDEDGMKSVAYGNITAVLIEALKEQQAQIEELKSRLDGLTK